jgi:hypothetical protein
MSWKQCNGPQKDSSTLSSRGFSLMTQNDRERAVVAIAIMLRFNLISIVDALKLIIAIGRARERENLYGY